MKCKNCGFENEQSVEYCVNCGESLACDCAPMPVEAVSLNPAADIVMNAIRDKLFLVLCVLMTASCVMSIITSGLSIINILLTIFLWLTYADAQKGFANEKHLRVISGTVYAQYIIINVLSVMLLVLGALIGVGFKFIAEDPELIEILTSELAINDIKIGDISRYLTATFGWVIAGLFMLIAIIMLIVNILLMRKIHRFAKSVYMGIMYQNPQFEKAQTVKNGFIFLAVCGGISTISAISAGAIYLISTLCTTAIMIIVAILIDRHFVKAM